MSYHRISVANLRKFALGLIVVLAFQVHPALAADWSMPFFRSAITVHNDASITVTETVQADFSQAKHGIYRNIPWRYQTNDGSSIQVPITIDRVERNNSTEPYTTSKVGDELVVKIGDANTTITGEQTYTIVYTAQAAVNFFTDHDELYWNATGTNWEVPLQAVETSVRLDMQVSKDQLQVKCFTGATGSTAQDCTATVDDSAGSFTANGQFLTVVFGWPKGVVTKPDNYDQLRTGGTTTNDYLMPLAWLLILNIGIPLVALGVLFWYWLRHGRDPKGPGTVIAQYDPPPGMTPGEMGVLMDETANHRDIIATMVDLAVRGYLTITEKEKTGLLGLQKSKDYILDKTVPKTAGQPLRPHEQNMLASLFSTGNQVSLSELKGTFADDVKKIQSHLYTQVAADGYFLRNPQTVRMTFLILGAVVVGLGFITVPIGIFALIPIGVMLILFGFVMPQRTPKGAGAYWHAKGFKLFLEKAEKYRIHWQEKENIFEAYLPYAMAFGVADKWTKAFASLQQEPPNWYHGSGGTFNTLMLWSALNNFSTVSAKSFALPAASGSSGIGGGGMSGGGFGGGGGGSW